MLGIVPSREPLSTVSSLAARTFSLAARSGRGFSRRALARRVGLDQDERAFRHRRALAIRRSRASSGSSRFLAFQKIQLDAPSMKVQGMIIAKRAMIDRDQRSAALRSVHRRAPARLEVSPGSRRRAVTRRASCRTGQICQSGSSGALQRRQESFSFVVHTGRKEVRLDRRPGRRDSARPHRGLLLHGLDLELALAHVLEVLGRPEEHVDQRADEGRKIPSATAIARSHGSSIRRRASL